MMKSLQQAAVCVGACLTLLLSCSPADDASKATRDTRQGESAMHEIGQIAQEAGVGVPIDVANILASLPAARQLPSEWPTLRSNEWQVVAAAQDEAALYRPVRNSNSAKGLFSLLDFGHISRSPCRMSEVGRIFSDLANSSETLDSLDEVTKRRLEREVGLMGGRSKIAFPIGNESILSVLVEDETAYVINNNAVLDNYVRVYKNMGSYCGIFTTSNIQQFSAPVFGE